VGFVMEWVDSPQSSSFEEMYRIYEESLPASEKKSRCAIEGLFGRGDYSLVVGKSADTVIAFAIIFESAVEPVSLLEYMAVDFKYRGRGYGKRLFECIREGARDRYILIEIDSDRDEFASDLDVRKRRLNFYINCGCKKIENLDYVMPTVSSIQPPVMDILICAPTASSPANRAILKKWINIIYSEVYGMADAELIIEKMLSRIQ